MSRQSWVEDRWTRVERETGKRVKVEKTYGQGKRWRARWVDPTGREQAKRFARKVDAEDWLAEQSAAMLRSDYVAPRHGRMTVEEWGARWLASYGTRRESTVRQARVHLRIIDRHLGPMLLADVKPSTVRSFMTTLKTEDYADSYVYAIHRRLSQIFSDAVHDGVLARNPCSRRTSPGAPEGCPYVATTEQVWALHDTVPESIRPAILLGAFAGLRVSETCGLRSTDVDFMRGVVSPEVQWKGEPLKSKASRQSIPIPRELATMLATSAETVLADELGRPIAPWTVERAVRSARAKVEGLPEGFRFHDLRHYFASMLIASGLDVKVVQTRARHASAMTTLNLYGHLMPDRDETSRAAVSAALRRPEPDTLPDTSRSS